MLDQQPLSPYHLRERCGLIFTDDPIKRVLYGDQNQ